MSRSVRISFFALSAAVVLMSFIAVVSGCGDGFVVGADRNLDYALRASGRNRAELERVLEHYRDDPEKLAAARFLICNMPGHESYRDVGEIDRYYDIALGVLKSGLSPVEQRDSLLHLSDRQFAGLDYRTVPDVRIVKADYLIHSIDHAFAQWKSNPWSRHVSFDDFCQWILPYKAVELQSLDCWRDTLYDAFSGYVGRMLRDDDQWGTTFYTVDALRNGILDKVHPVGMYNRSGYPLLRADLLARQTYGRCEDYVNLAVLVYRSFGIPVVIDYTPCWGRYRAGHSWYTLLSDRGEELHAEWDVGSVPGTAFFPDKRIPKVFRKTFSINRDRARYRVRSSYGYGFELCASDVTAEYFSTTDVDIDIPPSFDLAEEYAYIATFNGHGTDWTVVDFAEVRRGKARFRDMGRNVLYLALGYDGETLLPVSGPFVVRPDGQVEFLSNNPARLRSVELRRKYYQSNNVVRMRQRLLGGRLEASDSPDFTGAVTVLTIEDTSIPDRIVITSDRHRYWRWLAADGTYGSIAELAFFGADGTRLAGRPIGCPSSSAESVENAFDGDWLTNFETEEPDGAWVGMDFGSAVQVASVRIVPRSDDNDIHPGDEYELRYWHNAGGWVSRGTQTATGNTLVYDSIPEGALMWLSDKTRGWDERPFLIGGDGNVEWW